MGDAADSMIDGMGFRGRRTVRRPPKPSQFDYIRDYYGIALKNGMHVMDQKGRRGAVVGATHYVRVEIEGDEVPRYFHPQALSYPSLGIAAKEGA